MRLIALLLVASALANAQLVGKFSYLANRHRLPGKDLQVQPCSMLFLCLGPTANPSL